MQDVTSSDSDETECREDLLDRIEGLQADLDDAVSVAVARGAVEWARLNYPDHPSLSMGSKEMMSMVASSRSALNHARRHHTNMITDMRKYLASGGVLFVHLEEPPAVDEVERLIDKHAFAANALSEILADYQPETGALLEVSLQKMAQDVAKAERDRCLGAVARACAPIQGTPYIAGPRRFCEAIRALPDVEVTPVDLAQGLFR